MSRYIDADALKANCDIMVGNTTIGRRDYVMFHEIDSAPSIDIVRCGECVHCADDYIDVGMGTMPQFTCELGRCGESVQPNDFCSYGVKKGATEYIPLVRCKDCKWRNKFGCHNPIWGDGWGNYPPPNPSDDAFCSYGEREGE